MANQDPSWIPWMSMLKGVGNDLGLGGPPMPAKAQPVSGWQNPGILYNPDPRMPQPPSPVSQLANYGQTPFDASNTLSLDQVPYAVGVDPSKAGLPSPYPSPSGPSQGGGNGSFGASGAGGLGSGTSSYESALQALRDQYTKMAGAQRQAAEPMREGLSNLLGNHLQYDLSPLAALVDNWTGSNLARSYKAPENAQQRRQEIQGLQQGIAQSDVAANQSELQAAKDYASGQMDLAKFQNDTSYKNKMLDLENSKLGLEQQKIGLERAKASGGQAPKQWQYNAAGFGQRMLHASQQFEQLMNTPGIPQYLTSNTGAAEGILPSGFQNGTLRNYKQIQDNFISAVLRKESGAAISDAEYKREAHKYFPQAGDDQAALDKKKLARQDALQNMVETAGSAWNPSAPSLPPASSGNAGSTITPEAARAELARRRGTK